MNIRTLLIPVAAITLFAVAGTQDASAAPLRAGPQSAHFGGLRLGFDVGVHAPIGHRLHRGRRIVRPIRRGYWRTIRERVYHAPELVGYDSHGHEVYSPGHYDYVERRVWVPAPRIVRPRIYRPRGHVSIGLGGSWRIR